MRYPAGLSEAQLRQPDELVEGITAENPRRRLGRVDRFVWRAVVARWADLTLTAVAGHRQASHENHPRNDPTFRDEFGGSRQ